MLLQFVDVLLQVVPGSGKDLLGCESIGQRTRSACELAEIGYERLFSLFDGTLRDECPRILFAIGAQLTSRLLHTSRKVSRLAFMDVTSRVARTLVDLLN